jgi:HAD superfamily hydrolase (TIGR01509 family)
MKLQIPSGDFHAYLFDCDGTIVDSMPLHYIAWSRALGEWGCPFPEDCFYAWGGVPAEGIIARLNDEHGLHMPVAEVAAHKEKYYYENLAHLEAVPEVLEQINAAYGRIPFAVVSGSTRESVEKSLTQLNLIDKFPIRICAEDYTHGKPNPECYLKAASALNIDPSHCLVFEDTDMGIEAAKAAGMAWVRVPAPWERGK